MKTSTLGPALPSALKATMEDRKRPIVTDHEDGGPPAKKQATTVNGAPIKLEPEKEKDVENYQKESILRQMKEYKRERNFMESQVNDLTQRVSFHESNLRTINAWFAEALDEMHVIFKGLPVLAKDQEPFKSSLLLDSGAIWEDALKSSSAKILAYVKDVQSRAPYAPPEVSELQERVVALLAAEKAQENEILRVTAERDRFNERLEDAMYRYLVAEKKMDRMKSATVQKLEQSAIVKRDEDAQTTDKDAKAEKTVANGEGDPVASAEAESARQVAVAIADARKAQISQLELDNKRLNEQLSTVRVKATSPSEDDYARTSLFALSKSQMDDMIKRINDLRATNTQLQEEARKLQAERMSFRSQVEEESRTTVAENESQLARSEADLVRIRNIRDELTAEVAILKGSKQASADQSQASSQELAAAREDRIRALESELERLRLQYGASGASQDADLDSLGLEELKAKVKTLESQYQLLSTELPSMESAWRKASALASKKVADLASFEEQISRLGAEKAKADQKYFAAMKTKEAREAELRAKIAQQNKTGEIVTSLKDSEQSSRLLAAGLEKQVAEANEALKRLEGSNRTLQQKIGEADIARQAIQGEVGELKKIVSGKTETLSKVSEERRKVEVDLVECKARLDDAKKQIEQLRKRTAKGDAAEADDWRRLAICPVCNTNLRNTVLKLCNHVFCNNCVQDLISHRSRKCPACAKAFGVNDHMPVILT